MHCRNSKFWVSSVSSLRVRALSTPGVPALRPLPGEKPGPPGQRRCWVCGCTWVRGRGSLRQSPGASARCRSCGASAGGGSGAGRPWEEGVSQPPAPAAAPGLCPLLLLDPVSRGRGGRYRLPVPACRTRGRGQRRRREGRVLHGRVAAERRAAGRCGGWSCGCGWDWGWSCGWSRSRQVRASRAALRHHEGRVCPHQYSPKEEDPDSRRAAVDILLPPAG